MKASFPFVAGAALLAMASLVACGGGPAEPKAQAAGASAPPPVVDVAVVKAQSGTIEAALELSGNLAPQARVGVKPRVPGAIEKLLVDIGSQVREGQTIATIDRREIVVRRVAVLDPLADIAMHIEERERICLVRADRRRLPRAERRLRLSHTRAKRVCIRRSSSRRASRMTSAGMPASLATSIP